MKAYFWREGYQGSFDEGYEFEVNDFSDLEYRAEKFSQHYFCNLDGWESSWPITWNISDEDGILRGRVKVEMEMDPSFYGRLMKKESEGADETKD